MGTPDHWPRLWFRSLAAVCVSLLLLTFVHLLFKGSSQFVGFLKWFSLTSENNVASWWSGMLFLLVGLHAIDGFFLWRREEPKAARGWLALALAMFAFSVDEVGSLHERVSLYSPFGPWQSLVPFAILLVVLIATAIGSLGSSRLERKKAIPVAIAFLMFVSVAGQEVLEHRIAWPEPWKPFRSIAEEGTELLAALVLLAAAQTNTQGRFRAGGAFPVLEGVRSHRRWIFLGGFGMVPFFALASASFPDQGRGHPADWLAAAVFLLAALAAVRPFLAGDPMRWPRWALGATWLAASAGSVAIKPVFDDASIDALGISLAVANPRLVLLCLISSAVAVHWAFQARGEWRAWAPITAVMLVVSSTSLLSATLVTVYAVTPIVALLAYRAQTGDPRDRGGTGFAADALSPAREPARALGGADHR